MKKNKAIRIAEKREKAKENAFLKDFENINIKNYVTEVNLKGKMVEYEINMNPRFAKKESEYYNQELSSEEKVTKKSDGNFDRLLQIINNANENFKMDFQYIVFHKELVEDIKKWLESLKPLSGHLKYGKIDEDIVEFQKILPNIEKDWLVIDGNSYFSTIHNIYNAKNKKAYLALSDDIKYWSKYYAQLTSKGKGYTNKNISADEYYRSIQMIQLLSLVLEMNMHSWPDYDKTLYLQRLHRLTYAIVYRECKRMKYGSIKDVCSVFQAVKYLILPNGNNAEYQIAKRMDMILFLSLFEYTGNLEEYEQLNKTCFNINIFKQIMQGIITKQGNHLNYDKAMDMLNELYIAETEYQNLSLNSIKGIDSIQARDRFAKASYFLSKECLDSATQIKKDIISDNYSIVDIRNKFSLLVNNMIDDYNNFLLLNANKLKRNNTKLSNVINELYEMSHISNILKEEFVKLISDYIENINKKGEC